MRGTRMPKVKRAVPLAEKYPELTITAKDGTRWEVFRRKDRLPVPSRDSTRLGWGWRRRAVNGKVTETNGQPIERNSAVKQATARAGKGAKVESGIGRARASARKAA